MGEDTSLEACFIGRGYSQGISTHRWPSRPTSWPARVQVLVYAIRLSNTNSYMFIILICISLLYRWTVPLRVGQITTHKVGYARGKLDLLHEGHFVWQPYQHVDLPDMYLVGSEIWEAMALLICMDVVEMHLPDRVLRQFGL